MKKYLVSKDVEIRATFVKKRSDGFKTIGIYNQLPLRGLESYFDEVVTLKELYKDELFLRFLAKIDQKTIVFFVDLGLDYCSFKADYIKPFTKLNPIFQQAGNTYIIDSFIFYNTEKSIYRAFLYIDDLVLNSTVQEFYNSKGFESYEGNLIENYFKKIKPYIDLHIEPIEVKTIRYSPTENEVLKYNELKNDLIMVQKLPKQTIIKRLQKFIESSESKIKAVEEFEKSNSSVLIVKENTNLTRIKMYKDLALNKYNSVAFFSSGVYGVDEIELSKTKYAILRHNDLIRLING